MIRDGSTIPIAKMFQEVIQKSVLMLPLGAVDDGEHSQNEKINRWGLGGHGLAAQPQVCASVTSDMPQASD